jgi:catechol 2,3-dioxygenase-like lactoylglutathione lyase family enzyme
MISHVHVGVNDFDRALIFYSALMNELGLKMKFAEPDREWAGWVEPDKARPLFVIGTPFNGQHDAGNGQMVALMAAKRSMVDRAHAVALEHGGVCEGAPGLRPQYHADYYGAYFRDVDGNKLCVCCHEPE